MVRLSLGPSTHPTLLGLLCNHKTLLGARFGGQTPILMPINPKPNSMHLNQNMPSTSYNLTMQPYQQGHNPNMYQQPRLPPPYLHQLLPAPSNPSSSQALATLNPPRPTLFLAQPVPNQSHNRLPQPM